jgi:hypothetical protein
MFRCWFSLSITIVIAKGYNYFQNIFYPPGLQAVTGPYFLAGFGLCLSGYCVIWIGSK